LVEILDLVTLANISTVLSMIFAIISIAISLRTKKEFDKFKMSSNIKIINTGGNINIVTGNENNQRITEGN